MKVAGILINSKISNNLLLKRRLIFIIIIKSYIKYTGSVYKLTYTYKTQGTCSKQIEIEMAPDNETIQAVTFTGGCNGNLKGIAALVKGKKISEVKSALAGIKCGFKQTSCPDQLSRALEKIEKQSKDKQ